MKSLLYRPPRLTEPRHLLTFPLSLRFAVQELRALIRLPKMLAVLATLLLAVFAISAGASSAAAHGNHSHQVSTGTSGPDLSSHGSEMRQSMQGRAAVASSESQPETPGRHGKFECCCGSIICHAGVTLPIDLFSFLAPSGARLIPEPSSGQPQSDSSGLERPPRSLDIA
jgi:hypothetical protein